MSQINYNKIDEFIAVVPKPGFCDVEEEEWRNALLGVRESLSNADDLGFTTDTLWSAIYLSAMYFCKGMIWAETKSCQRPPSLYPRY